MNKLWLAFTFSVQLVLFFGCKKESVSETQQEVSNIPEFLPLTEVALSDLSFWNTDGTNWSLASKVRSDFQLEWNLDITEGTGILVNLVKDEGKRNVAGDGKHLFSKIEHGDLELELEVLVPKGSNSGIYLQSRYEVQIRDSHDDVELTSDDMGGIYAHAAPSINAARMPGLWQKLRIIFRAPRFDASGIKISNALFEKVYLNDFLIHDHVELLQPTTESVAETEVAKAPLMIQGDHGPVAFRNIRYKSFETEKSVELKEITYKIYEGKFDYIPDFSTLPLLKSGNAANFDKIPELAGYNDGINVEFEGKLVIPIDGNYLFETAIDDGGDLFIDGNLVVHNEGDPGYGVERNIIFLNAGEYPFKQTYYQEVWGSMLKVFVEGPGIEKRQIPTMSIQTPREKARAEINLEIEVDVQPELIRGFVNHLGSKKTHILSVGSSDGIHYSFDTRHNQLINVWKGRFADVSQMWINRGEEQLLQPLGAVCGLANNGMDLVSKGYRLNQEGFPTFVYSAKGVTIYDLIQPDAGLKGLKRTLTSEGGTVEFVLAKGADIQVLSNGWHAIDQLYLVNVHGDISIDNGTLKVKLVEGTSFVYLMNW
jgi:hypothetical protein